MAIVVRDAETQSVLLESRIGMEIVYQQRNDTCITWKESEEGTKVATPSDHLAPGSRKSRRKADHSREEKEERLQRKRILSGVEDPRLQVRSFSVSRTFYPVNLSCFVAKFPDPIVDILQLYFDFWWLILRSAHTIGGSEEGDFLRRPTPRSTALSCTLSGIAGENIGV